MISGYSSSTYSGYHNECHVEIWLPCFSFYLYLGPSQNVCDIRSNSYCSPVVVFWYCICIQQFEKLVDLVLCIDRCPLTVLRKPGSFSEVKMAAQDVYEISVRIGLVRSLLAKLKMVGYSALTMVSASSKLNA